MTYGRGLARAVVKVDDNRQTPAHAQFDGVDYVPGHPLAIFGHHFASIAGAGPITGPAIAVIWGWLPALLWIWLGNFIIGAVHDYLALMASVRSEGKSIQWIAGKTMKPRTARVMMVFIYFTLVLVVAAFMAVATTNFVGNPGVASASMLFLVAAMVFGFLAYRAKMNFSLATVIGLVLVAGAIWLGLNWGWTASPQTWVIVLAIYAVIASSLPVWLLLQPRDYLNSYILFLGLGAGIIALLVAFKGMTLPSFTMWSAHAVGNVPSPFWPAIPLVVACGSLSGFHSLVASGTTSKQLDKESHGLAIGYGGMLFEGVLATVVVVAMGAYGFQVLSAAADQLVGAGISLARLQTDGAYFGTEFLKAAGPVGGALGVFTRSYGTALAQVFGVTVQFGTVFAGLWVTAFVLTTLDTATRIARFTWQEFFDYLKDSNQGLHKVLTDRWVAGLIVVILAGYLAYGGSYTVIWPAFAGANQLLAAIAMLTAALWAIKIQKASSGYQWAIVIPGAALWITVFVGLIWYVWAVPASLIIKTIFVIMAALSLMLLVDFFDGYKRREELPAGVAGRGR